MQHLCSCTSSKWPRDSTGLTADVPPPPQAKEARLGKVQLEGHVVLKIVKHCQECAPDLVTGQLLGLDVGATLEVTDAFPFPVRAPSPS